MHFHLLQVTFWIFGISWVTQNIYPVRHCPAQSSSMFCRPVDHIAQRQDSSNRLRFLKDTHLNTQILKRIVQDRNALASVSFHIRCDRWRSSGNGAGAGEWFSQTTSPTDAECAGPRVFWHHTPPQGNWRLWLCDPHVQEQTSTWRWVQSFQSAQFS